MLDTLKDNLGDHTAAQNLLLNGNWLSGDGDDEGIFVDGNGNVGIGTNTPFSNLHIVDNSGVGSFGVRLSTTNPNGMPNVELVNDAGTQGSLFLTGSSSPLPGILALSQSSANPLALAVGGLPRLFINGTGNIGIGNFAPDANLHVTGSFKLEDGNEAANYVLTSDADGLASWQPLPTPVATTTTWAAWTTTPSGAAGTVNVSESQFKTVDSEQTFIEIYASVTGVTADFTSVRFSLPNLPLGLPVFSVVVFVGGVPVTAVAYSDGSGNVSVELPGGEFMTGVNYDIAISGSYRY